MKLDNDNNIILTGINYGNMYGNTKPPDVKEERFLKIIQSAMKQSLHYHLPKLNALTSFKDFITQTEKSNTFIAHCEETQKRSLKECIQRQQKYTILIGPEGDFSTSEIELALTSGITPVTLGNSRLRTETAAVVACHRLLL